MAFLEWRKFNFFDLHNNADGGKIAEALQDTTISVVVSGNAHVVVCDATGWVHLVSRAWTVSSFRGYELTVTLACQLQHEPFLVTVGEDVSGSPVLKVWDWSRLDRHGNPKCVRISQLMPSHGRVTPATALAVLENKSLVAVGFEDGSVCLYRGDLTRQRGSKVKTLVDTGNTAITGLAFKGSGNLFVTSRSAVTVYWLEGGGAGERAAALDAGGGGAAAGCSVLADQHLMVAKTDAIYCYTVDGRGPCYALEGQKRRLDWFRSYLAITTVDKAGAHHLTLLDIHNRFIVLSQTLDNIQAVVAEWGALYILTESKEVVYLEENDLQTKLALLFKRKLYDVAVRLASSQHYDAEGLAHIYKHYGDHLYNKGDAKGAVEQYVKTIGRLETSYVIRKYLDSRHLEPLIFYLQELHKKGLATEDHTTLLLTCLVKVDQSDERGRLREALHSAGCLHFDVDVAIKVVRQASPSDALLLARNNARHDSVVRILLEDLGDASAALAYIADLALDDAAALVAVHGAALFKHDPDETTRLLQLMCTDYTPRSRPLVDEWAPEGARREASRVDPDPLLPLFLYESARLVQFLRAVVAAHPAQSPLVYNALLEHSARVWSKSPEEEKESWERYIMSVLESDTANYDRDQTLIVCQMLGFKPGTLYLYEKSKLWRSQLSVETRAGRFAPALQQCRQRGALCPPLWTDLLRAAPPASLLAELGAVVDHERLLSPTQVMDSLAAANKYTLGDVRKYLSDVLAREAEAAAGELRQAGTVRAATERMRDEIVAVQHEPVVFQSSRCTACGLQLELPAIHFLCRHSYHLHCYQSISGEEDGACPACLQQLGAPAAAAARPAPAEFYSRVHTDRDPYEAVSEYLGRGLFTQPAAAGAAGAAVELQPRPATPAPRAPAPSPAPASGPGAEARQRLHEGISKDLYISEAASLGRAAGAAAVPEGRMRVLEEAAGARRASRDPPAPPAHPAPRLDRPAPLVHAAIPSKRQGFVQQTSLPSSPRSAPPATASAPAPNPFDEAEQDYDETKNPFADEEPSGSNPFGDDDYDNNLNPFA